MVGIEATQAARPVDGFVELRLTGRGMPTWLASDGRSGRRLLWGWDEARGARRLSPPQWDIASRVNGYGGGAHTPLADGFVVVRGDDQTLHWLSGEEARPRPYFARRGCAYGGLVADPGRSRVLAVESQGEGRQAVQRLVALSPSGRRILVEGADFFGAPALSPDGRYLAWVEWSLPDMPWQRSRLRLGEFRADGGLALRHAWEPRGAVTQPRFAEDGRLICLSDRQDWWQPWEVRPDRWRCLSEVPVDHATTPWQLGECQHAWWPGGGVVMRLRDGWGGLEGLGEEGSWRLAGTGRVSALAAAGDRLYALTQGPDHGARLIRLDRRGGRYRCLVEAEAVPGTPLAPRRLEAPVGRGESVSAFVYRPAQARPAPLIMRVHGGPTAASYPIHDPLVAWWCALGYAVADLNPRGSGNQGRAFRERLAGGWGRLDVEDALAMADALVARGIADPGRLLIRGQSAGGFTVLNVLAASRRFLAGASLYGVTDARRLARQTHRFESGYLDWLIGDEAAKAAASPIQRLGSEGGGRVLFFQGARDRVVVPEQTLAMAARLRRGGRAARVVLFADEGHGIRHPANRLRLITREAAFFAAAQAAAGHDQGRKAPLEASLYHEGESFA